MRQVTIYTRPFCGYCAHALALLKEKGAAITEISMADHPEKRAEMIARSNGGRTFPQIFVGPTHVGGCDDLIALDARGGLESLLQDA